MTYTRARFIPIPPGAKPGFDHADIYRDGAGTARLYVAHTGADRVDVIDGEAGTWLRALDGHPGVTGVLVDRVGVGPHPNGLAFDAGRGRLFSFSLGGPAGENCTASVVADSTSQEILETVPTEPGAHTLGIDPDRHAVYAFLPASGGAAVYQDQRPAR